MKNNIWNISSSHGFAEVLAQHILHQYANDPSRLPELTILLPNRRAVRAMKDAFVREKGLVPTLLPRMMPLGEVEEDELFLSGNNSQEILSGMKPAISSTERLLLFIRIIMAKPTDFGIKSLSLSQACYLAQELSSLIDMSHNQQLSFSKLKTLVPEDYASHWQETLKLLEIITQYWPHILEERKLTDVSVRRNLLLETQSNIWKHTPPKNPIIIAGTTAAFPAMKQLVKTVLSLSDGEIFLAGLDKHLPEEDWLKINETHPQFELKELLDYLELTRDQIPDLVTPRNNEVEAFVSEIMRPAQSSDKWLELRHKTFGPQAWRGINLIDCANIREEALAISLIMRETLEEEGKTAALITSDRNLARRVATELERWNIHIDDSAGKPLSFTPTGIFLRQIIQAAASEQKLDILKLIKNPLFCLGKEYSEIKQLVRRLDKNVWRQETTDEEAELFAQQIGEALLPLKQLLKQPFANFQNLLQCHIQIAEKIASRQDKSGDKILWQGEAGETAAHFIADIYEHASILEQINPVEYKNLLESLMINISFRPKYGMHPRLKILGPIEARLNHFDVTIIGEANEGIWPQNTGSDPWMSRPMKKDFGFPLPERQIGVMAFDFSQLLCGEEVYITRAARVQSTPMVKSRWWLRLETVIKALKLNPEILENSLYSYWAKQIDTPKIFENPTPPKPCPPLKYRPTELSASGIEMLMRDPYSVFAKYILKLYPLNEPDKELSAADYGNIIHAILQQFNNQHPTQLPANAKAELIKLGEEYFEQNQIAAETKIFWWSKFINTVDWLLETEQTYRENIIHIYNEIKGKINISTPRGFAIKAIADRIDITKDGYYNIIDYKTGHAKTEKEVRSGYAPQLPIEGLIAKHGGFANLPPQAIKKLIYWELTKDQTEISDNIDELLDKTYERIQKLANLFEFENTPYLSRPNPKKAPTYSDYNHLARVQEWSILGDKDES